MPVWPLKWLLGRSEAETAGKFVKGKNSVKSVLCWQDPKSAQTRRVLSSSMLGLLGLPGLPGLLASLCSLGSSQRVLLEFVPAKTLRVRFPV